MRGAVSLLALLASPALAEMPGPLDPADFMDVSRDEAELGQLLFYDPILSGGREVAWLAMQAHPDHEELQRRGQRVLDCLLDPPAPPADRGEGPV